MASLERDRFIAWVTIAYALGAAVWIFLSDRLVALLFADAVTLTWLASAKGLIFVLVTAALLFSALRRVPQGGALPAPVLDAMIRRLPFELNWPTRLGYLFALLLSLAIVWLSQILSPFFGEHPLYVLMLFPVVLSAVLGGRGPGVLATISVALGADLLFIEPFHELRIRDSSHLLQLGLLVLNGLLISALSGMLHRIRIHAEAGRQLQAVVLASIGDAVVACDLDGRVFFLNEVAELLCGYSSEAASNRPLAEVFPLFPDEEAGASVAGDVAPNMLVLRDGRRIPVQSHTAPIHMADGRKIGQVLVAHDDTERRTIRMLQQQHETRFLRLVKLAPLALCLVDTEGKLLYGNDRFTAFFGYQEEELKGAKGWWQRIYPDPEYRAVAKAAWDVAVANAQATNSAILPAEFRVRCADGEDRQVEISGIPVDEGMLCTFYDVTARRRAEAALIESEERLASAIEGSGIGLWEWWPDTRCTHLNEQFAQMLGYKLAELEPISEKTLYMLVDPADREDARERMLRHLAGDEPVFEIEARMMHKDGSLRWGLIRGRITERNAGGLARRISGTLLDVTERHLASERIAELAFRDTLTGLPNRKLLRDRVEQAINHCRRNKTSFVLAFLDLDGFKMVNDSLGHAAGDCLLKSVSARLESFVRAEDTVARLGGDEFVLLLSDTDAMGALQIVPGMHEDIACPYEIEGHNLTVSASIGICVFPNDGTDFDSLLRAADVAMYEAKSAGRNTFRFFRAEMNDNAVSRLELEEALRHAIAHGGLRLHYQPQFDLVSGHLVGYEALLYWNDPLLGEVPPSRFHPLAESTGLIVEIGRWALHEACLQNQRWVHEGVSEVPVAVRLSPLQFKRGEVEREVISALAESGLAPGLLELEVTEELLADANGKISLQLSALKQLGVRLAIDDFGAGYSNFIDIKRFSIDRIKIDPSFVRDLFVDSNNRGVTAAIVGMAKALQLDVIAEGVETPEQVSELVQLGCHLGQGCLGAASPSIRQTLSDTAAHVDV